MRGKYFSDTSIFIILFFLIACNGPDVTNEADAEQGDNMIQITQQQFDAENMEIGEIVMQAFDETIQCNGYIKAPPNGMAQVSTQISGIVESIYCSIGDYVKKGQVLCRLTSTELIMLQQDFAETSVKLKLQKADWERSKALYEEKIGAKKDYLATESAYQITKAKYQTLKLRLENLDLDVAKIEAGELYGTFPIMAPISGFITDRQIVLGQYIEYQKQLMEIVDINQLRLQLSVFENDIKYIKVGQHIHFKSVGESETNHSATLTSIGKTINPETKTISCIGKINKPADFKYINNTYIEAQISVNQTEAKALPSDAILKSGQDYYVLVPEKSENQNYYLRKVKVNIGRNSNGFTEIIDGEGLTKVVTKGVYNLQQE